MKQQIFALTLLIVSSTVSANTVDMSCLKIGSNSESPDIINLSVNKSDSTVITDDTSSRSIDSYKVTAFFKADSISYKTYFFDRWGERRNSINRSNLTLTRNSWISNGTKLSSTIKYQCSIIEAKNRKI
jgi:hypothetical protein